MSAYGEVPLRFRVALAVLWPLALVYWIYDRAAHYGLNILDDGLVAAYSDRILHGQVPHRDFITPRPAGTPILHLVDFAVPLPLYLSVRLVGTAEAVAFSLLLAWLIFDAAPWRWGPLQALGAAGSALVNLHTFPLDSWYTSDGLLFVAAGLLLVRSSVRTGDRRRALAGIALSGASLLMKQSFFLAPALTVGYLVYAHRALGPRRLLVKAAWWIAVAAAPALVYAIVITAFGGFHELIVQTTRGHAVWGRQLLEMVGLASPSYLRSFPWQAGALVAALVVLRGSAPRSSPAGVALRVALAAAITYYLLRLPFDQNLRYLGTWSLQVTWVLIVAVAAELLVRRRVDWAALAVLAIAWMSMLSWGYPLPALTAGTMALAVLTIAFRDFRLEVLTRARLATIVSIAVAAAVFVFTADQFTRARADYPYWDHPKQFLTQTVGDVSPDLRGIHTSPVVTQYLHGLVGCLERYPAHWTAVLPDNPGLYPAMHLHNPLPVDWLYFTDTYSASRGQILSAVRRLQQRGDYLVLFQTVSGVTLPALTSLPPATRRMQPAMFGPSYDPQLAGELVRMLQGTHVVCGSFLGLWSPHRN